MVLQRGARFTPRGRGRLLCLLAAIVSVLVICRGDISFAYKLMAARRALRSGDAQRTIQILDQVDLSHQASAEWHYVRARAERRRTRFAAAEQHLAQARAWGWDVEDVRREALLLKARQGQIKKVEPLLVQLLESGLGDDAAEDVYETMSQAYWAAYYVEDALKCLKFWSAWQTKNLTPRLWTADLFKRSDRPNAAIAQYRDVLAIDPHNNEALVKLGELLLKGLEVDAASAAFEQCLEQSPETPDALLGLADCRRRKGAVDEVKDLLYEMLTLELTPVQHSQALAMLGTLALEDRDYSRAVQLLQSSVSFDANDAAIHVSLAAALTAIGKDELAAAARQRARDTSDRHARLTRTCGKAVEDPENADLRCEAGLILMEQGFWLEGADWIRTAIEIDPGHSAAHEGMAKYYEHTGNLEKAIRHRSLANRADQAQTDAKGKGG